MKLVAFARYGARAASTRQRLLQYLPHFHAAGTEVEWHPLLDDDYVESLATGEEYPKRRVLRAYFDRVRQLVDASRSDLIWVYVELFPYLPAFLELLATAGKRVVYDFDDAFFHDYNDSSRRIVRAVLSGKHAALLSRAAAVCCGNAYLRDFAAQYCRNSIILPTVVDADIYRPVEKKGGGGPVTIGWIGSPSTWSNVRPLLPMIEQLCGQYGARMRVIGAGGAAKADAFDGLELIEWQVSREVADVQAIDIGIMPLIDRPFERGKSGYKLIQYMACGLPVVASPVGANAQIVAHGNNGFLATDEAEWRAALVRLIEDSSLRTRMGRSGRNRVEANYSLEGHAPRLLELFRAVTES